MASSRRLLQAASVLAAMTLAAGLSFAAVDKTAPQPKCVGKDCASGIAKEPDKGPGPKCSGKDCSASMISKTSMTKSKAVGATVNTANKGASKVKQATGGDDGGGDGGLKSKSALGKGALEKNKLAPPPPGNINKAAPNAQMHNVESPRDPASGH